jgi:hypothetical protein
MKKGAKIMDAVLVEFPQDLIKEIDKIAGSGRHTEFLVEMAERQIKLLRQKQALKEVAGAWKLEDHPELAQGSDAYVRWLRSLDQQRMEEIEAYRESR